MGYLTQDAIANNRGMLSRVAQAAAEEKVSSDPDRWTYEMRRTWAAAPGWDEAWEYFLIGNPESDPGIKETVITDEMILSQVQTMLGLI